MTFSLVAWDEATNSFGSVICSSSPAVAARCAHQADGAAAAGNLLASDAVPRLMVEAWHLGAGQPAEARLLAAFRAAMAAGGEAGPVHSAGLSVVAGYGWRVTDLRVDWADDPLAALEALLAVWLPQRDDYIARALRPEASPGYGVPGDER